MASNVAPSPVVRMVRAALDGDYARARKLHLKCYRLFVDLFIDTNPIPVKAALAMMGQIEEVYRLPLCPMAGTLRQPLRKTLKDLNLV